MLISFLPIQLAPPDKNHAEISLFGPGIGECIVLHFGDGRWFIIDSCLCPDTKKPIALSYLSSIGVNVATQVIGILITHWHSDHIEGAFELLKECKNARLFASSALSSNEAFHLAAIYKKDVFANSDKEIREFSDIAQYLYKNNQRDRFDSVKAYHTFFDYKDKIQTRMIALSPSNTAVTQSISNLIQIKPEDGSDRVRNILPESENLNAVAIHFTFGDFSAVLGSDLEKTDNNLTGWPAVFKNNIKDELSLSLASLYKVSHHGSKTGHHDNIWSDLLINNPIAITTPFSRSGLPTLERIEEIKSLSSEFLVTRDPKSGKIISRESMVDREMRAATKERKSINSTMGHIQLRAKYSGELTIAASESCIRHSK